MKKRRLLHLVWLSLLFLALMTGLVGLPTPTTLAQGPPPERPQPPPGAPGSAPGRPHPPETGQGPTGLTAGTGGIPSQPCSGVHGFVLNWGYRNEPKLPVELSGDSWQTQKGTDDNGYYAFDCLGIGVGLLNPVLPPELHPLTTDVAIRLGYQADFEINLGLYSSQVAPSLDVTSTMTVSSGGAAPGETLTYTIRVTNTSGLAATGYNMYGVMVTDLLPKSLTPMGVTSTVGTTEVWGNLLTTDVGELVPGQAVTITVITSVREDTLPGAIIANRASLIYKDHIAVQTVPITVQVGTATDP